MLSNLDLFTVKVFKVPENDMLKESNKPDVTEKERPFPLTDMHLIEEHHNMTSARVIRGKLVELQHTNLVGESVKFKTILNFERSLEPGCSLGILLTPQDSYITKPDSEETV